jgi:hypothetical protein
VIDLSGSAASRPSGTSVRRAGGRRLLWKVQQSDLPGLPFDERTDRRALVLADYEVAFRKLRPWSGKVGCGLDRLA